MTDPQTTEQTEQTEQTETRKVPCLVMSRVVGYLSVVRNGERYHWHAGKAAEWEDRRTYNVGKAVTRAQQ